MNISRIEFLQIASVDAATLDCWLEEKWLVPDITLTELRFSDIDLARANLIRSLTHDLGVNLEGVGIILHLLDQVYSLRNALSMNSEEITFSGK